MEKVFVPSDADYLRGAREVRYQIQPYPLEGEPNDSMEKKESELSDSRMVRGPDGKTCLVTQMDPLHPLDVVGIDTCLAMSVSTLREDFPFLDCSEEERSSVVLRGVGGSEAVIGGRGPMVSMSEDQEGKEILIIDPSGSTYLKPSTKQISESLVNKS